MNTWHEVLIEPFKHKLIKVIPIIFQSIEVIDGDVVDELIDDFVRLGEEYWHFVIKKENQ